MKFEWQHNDKKQHIFISGESVAIIGRARECDIVLSDPYVSRHHAMVGYEDGVLVMRTLNTKNPITVNDIVQISGNDSYIIREGDSFQLGQVKMKAYSPTRLHAESEPKTAELKILCQNCGGRASGTGAKCVWCGAELFDQGITENQ